MSALGRPIDQALFSAGLAAGLELDEESDLVVEPLESDEDELDSLLAEVVSFVEVPVEAPSLAEVEDLPRESVR
jgi:hypothetical protein